MTRQMEHLFLKSADHLNLVAAIRIAEVRALGDSIELASVVAASRLGIDESNGAFWRSVIQFFVNNEADMPLTLVAPMVEFLESIRHTPMPIYATAGQATAELLLPQFSMKGRSFASMLRLLQGWGGKDVGRGGMPVSWPRAAWQPLVVREPPRTPGEGPIVWTISELCTSAELWAEGRSMSHCVGRYGHDCIAGWSSIWSVRRYHAARRRSIMTIEVRPRSRTIVEFKGRYNRKPNGKPVRLMRLWAEREGLKVYSDESATDE